MGHDRLNDLSPDELEIYVKQLEGQVRRCVIREPKDFGRAASQMYNIFSLRGLSEEAAYLKELFDEPAKLLYCAGSMLHEIEEIADADPHLLHQIDELILMADRTIEDGEEIEIVRVLLRLRSSVAEQSGGVGRPETIALAREKVLQLVNDFFYDRLTALPTLRDYIVKMELGM